MASKPQNCSKIKTDGEKWTSYDDKEGITIGVYLEVIFDEEAAVELMLSDEWRFVLLWCCHYVEIA